MKRDQFLREKYDSIDKGILMGDLSKHENNIEITIFDLWLDSKLTCCVKTPYNITSSGILRLAITLILLGFVLS